MSISHSLPLPSSLYFEFFFSLFSVSFSVVFGWVELVVTGFKVVDCFSNCWVRIGGGRLGVGWVSRWRSGLGMGHGGDRV